MRTRIFSPSALATTIMSPWSTHFICIEHLQQIPLQYNYIAIFRFRVTTCVRKSRGLPLLL